MPAGVIAIAGGEIISRAEYLPFSVHVRTRCRSSDRAAAWR